MPLVLVPQNQGLLFSLSLCSIPDIYLLNYGMAPEENSDLEIGKYNQHICKQLSMIQLRFSQLTGLLISENAPYIHRDGLLKPFPPTAMLTGFFQNVRKAQIYLEN